MTADAAVDVWREERMLIDGTLVAAAEGGAPLALTHGAHLDTPIEGVGWVADLAERYEWVTDLGEAEPFGMRLVGASYKQSGIGREMGVAGFEEYLETKAVAEGVR